MNVKQLVVRSTACCALIVLAAMTPTAQATPEAICVMWEPDNAALPHVTYSGATVRVKGIARGGATQFRWDFGDGDTTPWTNIADPYNLGVEHVYTGLVGRLFVATLYVRNAGGEVAQDPYLIRILESSDLSNPQHLDVRINMAIDEGLWWLHTTMIRATYPAGEPGYEQPYGYGQTDSGAGRGGWRYYANYNESDMSTTQWPPLSMFWAEKNMGEVLAEPGVVCSYGARFRLNRAGRSDEIAAQGQANGKCRIGEMSVSNIEIEP